MMQRSASWLVACAATLVVGVGCEREPGDVGRTPSTEANPPAADTGTQDFQDGWITTKIQAAYFTDTDVKGRNIDVTTNNGVVTLTGTVEDQKAREQAVAIAQNIDGVTNVEDRLSAAAAQAEAQPPAGAPPAKGAGEAEKSAQASGSAGQETEVGTDLSNAWITTKIEAQYFADDAVKGRRIDVTTNNGVVTLEGQVQSDTEKQRAMEIARQTDGVRRVEDRLRVTAATAETGGPAEGAPGAPPPAPMAGQAPADPAAEPPVMAERMSDEGITTRVQSKLFLDDMVKGRDIDVNTSNGEVTLSGQVASEAEKQQALSVVRSVAGVSGVQDELQVSQSVAGKQPGPARAEEQETATTDDAWITTKVQSEYFLDEEVKKGDVEVKSDDGVVRLTGEVPSPEAKKRAETIAKQVSGVSAVENELSVNPQQQQQQQQERMEMEQQPPDAVSPVQRPPAEPGTRDDPAAPDEPGIQDEPEPVPQ